MRVLTQQEFPFVGPTDFQLSPYADAQRSINLFYEPAYQGSSPALLSTPGTSATVATLTDVSGGRGCRALWAGNGRLFAAGGAHAYEISTQIGGGIIQDYGAMAGDNGLSVHNRCYIVGGPAGPMLMLGNPYSQQVYFFDPVGHTMISKFNGFALEFLDGFFISIATGASLVGTNPNQVNVSAFNDGTTWPALAFIIKEGSVDALMNLAVVNNLLWIFGQDNIEIWYNAGLPNFPFARMNGGTLNVGLACAQSVVKISNGVMWLGQSAWGHGIVYMAKGNINPVRVSTPGVEQLISQALQANATILDTSWAFSYTEYGHEFYVLVLNTGIPALAYDITTGLWHERSVGGVNPSGIGSRDMPFTVANVSINPAPLQSVYSNMYYADQSSGVVALYGRNYTSNNGSSIFRMRTTPNLSDSLRWAKYPSFEVSADVGTATLNLMYSNNGGKTYGTLNRPDVAKTGSNDQGSNTAGGTYPRFRWTQLGRARRRSYGVWCLDSANQIALTGAVATITEGSEKRRAA